MPGSWRGEKNPNFDCHQNLPAVCHGEETTDADTLTCPKLNITFFFCWYLLKEIVLLWEDPFDNCKGRGSTSNVS